MDSMHPRPGGSRVRRLSGVLMTLTLLVGLTVAPATAQPAAPVPAAPLDQSVLLGRVVPGLVDIDTTLGYQGAAGAGTANI